MRSDRVLLGALLALVMAAKPAPVAKATPGRAVFVATDIGAAIDKWHVFAYDPTTGQTNAKTFTDFGKAMRWVEGWMGGTN